ncbi:MAG: argininosuccinate lyase, partial [Flavobacteriaceae bacterium]
PHKKNPDVFELIRAKGNALQGVSVQISTILANLPTGYHRDLQLTKPMLMDSFLTIDELLSIFSFSLSKMTPSKALLEQEKYTYLWSVDTLNSMVSAGMPFRDAYKKMAEDIATNNYVPNKEAAHTHLGSIGNLGLDLISKKLEAVVENGNYSGLSSEK